VVEITPSMVRALTAECASAVSQVSRRTARSSISTRSPWVVT
jgi:hypothetical protein